MPHRLSALALAAFTVAACGPEDAGEDELDAAGSPLVKGNCVLTDDLTDTCGCASYFAGPDYRYVVGSTSDVDFVRFRVPAGSSGNLTFRTLSPVGEPAIDTFCTQYDSSCRAVNSADNTSATELRHCLVQANVSARTVDVDLIFSVRSSWAHTAMNYPLTGGYKMSVVLNGHEYIPPPPPPPPDGVAGDP